MTGDHLPAPIDNTVTAVILNSVGSSKTARLSIFDPVFFGVD